MQTNKSLKFKDLQIEKAREYAISNGGECLTKKYTNSHKKLEWKCHNTNHSSWFSSYNNVVNLDCWCPFCAKNSMIKKKTLVNGLQTAKDYAKSKDGMCLSREYINSHSSLEWKCKKNNHSSWFAKYRNVINNGNWCPECAKEIIKNKKILDNGLEKAKEYALNKGGVCLSKKYINANTKMEWKCSNLNHKSWFSKYSHIKNGRWCPECGKENMKKKKMLENGLQKAKEHALTKKGECLSNECVNSQSKLEWKCHNSKHPSWFAKYTNVVNNENWCRQCRIELDFPKEKYLKIAKSHAKSKNGKCLSNEYINNRKKMEWKCENKAHNSWFAVYTSIINHNSWCPECALDYNKQELKVQQILNYLFKTNFEKTRDLKWNINPKTNFILELDGYSKELKIAFEFQGRHHFEDNIFKGTKLSDVQYKDKIKKENCKKNGVELIIINELKNNKNCLRFFNKIIEGIEHTNLTIPIYDYNEIEKLYNHII